MASPQKEDGYTPIANEIMEALARVNIGYGNAQILYATLRKTYGWHKKKDKISISQFEEITGLSRRMVIYCVQNLEAKKILIVERKRGRGNINEINEISFNKNYKEWVVQEKSKQYQKVLNNKKIQYLKSKNKVVQEIEGSARKGKRVVQENKKHPQLVAPTKETITKEILQKKEVVCFDFEKRKFLNITIEDKAGWIDAYPAVDVDQELREMREWLLSHPEKAKKRYRQFITGWLSRRQDKLRTKLSYEEQRKKKLDDWVKKPLED